MDFAPHTIVTPASGLAVDIELVKKHLRISLDQTDEEDYLTDFVIPAAMAFCENEVVGRRQFLTATCEVTVSDWWDAPSPLPLPPLQSVTSIKYLDTIGDEQTLSTDDYIVRPANRQRGTVEFVALQLPFLYQWSSYPITIRFVCGYGAASAIPAAIRQAILLTCGWLYRDREPTKVEFDAVKRLVNSEGFGWY